MKKPALHFAQVLGHEILDKRLDILRRIGEVGSISEAARGARVSYKAAWQALETLGNLAGSVLVEKAVGGTGGGGAHLTQAGRQLLEAAEQLNQARSTVLSRLEKSSGNTLSLSGLAGLSLRTSMRNQIPCQITAITQDEGVTRVSLALANGALFVSRITHESAELLGLELGMSVLALCKATAVTVGVGLAACAGRNLLTGEVTRVTASLKAGETSVQLMPGLQLVGFCCADQVLAEGQLVLATVDEAAVVLAIPG